MCWKPVYKYNAVSQARVLRFFLRRYHAVVCCRAAAVVASHVHTALKRRTGRHIKHLHIKGDYHTFVCGQITYQHGQRIAAQISYYYYYQSNIKSFYSFD